MNRTSFIALATIAAALLAATPAHAALGAGEGQAGYPHEIAATAPAVSLSRAEVRAEAARAVAEGRIASGEAGLNAEATEIAAVPGPTRAQVRAEAAEAVRLGLIASGEAAVVYTAPQLAALQAASERAGAIIVAGQR
jgi:hypothetical protein